MKITVRQAADAHEAPGPVSDYIGRNIPLRIGELAYTAELEAVEQVDGDDVLLTFDVPDSDLRWEVLRGVHTDR